MEEKYFSCRQLAKILGISPAAVSNAINKSHRLQYTEYQGPKQGILIEDPLTIAFATEICIQKGIPLPEIFKKKKSDVQLLMEGVSHAWTEVIPEEDQDLFSDFKEAVIDYVRSEIKE